MAIRGLLSMAACAVLLGGKIPQNPPVADPVVLTVAPGESVLIPFSGSDADGDLFGFFPTGGLSDPSAGVLLVSCVCRGAYAGIICNCATTFIASADFAGTVAFTYRAVDLEGNESADATVTINSTVQARTPTQILADIRFIVERGLQPGGEIDPVLGTALNAKLDAAEASLVAGNLEAAKWQMGAFRNQILNSPEHLVGPDAKQTLGERCDAFKIAIESGETVGCKHKPGKDSDPPSDEVKIDGVASGTLAENLGPSIPNFFFIPYAEDRTWTQRQKEGIVEVVVSVTDPPGGPVIESGLDFVSGMGAVDFTREGTDPCCHTATSTTSGVLGLFHHVGLDTNPGTQSATIDYDGKVGFALYYVDCNQTEHFTTILWTIDAKVEADNQSGVPALKRTGTATLERTVKVNGIEIEKKKLREIKFDSKLTESDTREIPLHRQFDPKFFEFDPQTILSSIAEDLKVACSAAGGNPNQTLRPFAHGGAKWVPTEFTLKELPEPLGENIESSTTNEQ